MEALTVTVAYASLLVLALSGSLHATVPTVASSTIVPGERVVQYAPGTVVVDVDVLEVEMELLVDCDVELVLILVDWLVDEVLVEREVEEVEIEVD